MKLTSFIQSICILSSCLLFIAGCNKASQTQSATSDPEDLQLVYAEVSLPFTIDGRIYKVEAKQLDLTEQAMLKGDTLSRPTFACLVSISNDEPKVIFSDSLLRDSWGYVGKINAIESYQIAMPLITQQDEKIIFSFKVFETSDDDAIEGIISFDVKTMDVDYSWKEALMEE